MANVTSAPAIAVTGAAGYVGSMLLQELGNHASLGPIIAIDVRRPSIPSRKVSAYQLDITGPLDTLFREHRIKTVVHLAFDLREGRSEGEAASIRRNNLRGLDNLLQISQTRRVDHFIYLSSHTVYGAHADNPVPITEEAPLRPLAGFQYSQTKALSEEALQRFAQENPGVGVTVLRCCMVIGHGRDNYVAEAFQKPMLIKLAGYNPALQFIHEKDLAQLLALFILKPRAGVFNVAGEGVVRYSRLARILRRGLLPLPSFVAYPVVQLAWKLGLQKNASSAGLNFIRYPIILSTGKLKQATGFRCQYTAEEAVSSYAALNLA